MKRNSFLIQWFSFNDYNKIARLNSNVYPNSCWTLLGDWCVSGSGSVMYLNLILLIHNFILAIGNKTNVM